MSAQPSINASSTEARTGNASRMRIAVATVMLLGCILLLAWGTVQGPGATPANAASPGAPLSENQAYAMSRRST